MSKNNYIKLKEGGKGYVEKNKTPGKKK